MSTYWNFVTQMISGALAKAEDVNVNLSGIDTGLSLIETDINQCLKVTSAPGTVAIALNAAARANKILAFDGAGNLVASADLGTWRGAHAAAAGTAYNERDLVQDTTGSIGLDNLYIATATHTSTGTLATDIANWDLILDVSAAAAIYLQFDARYLGSKASAPTLDNEGTALIDGALYWNTTTNTMLVYDLGTTTWVALALAIGGVDTQVQFNNAGALDGAASLTYNTGTGTTTAFAGFRVHDIDTPFIKVRCTNQDRTSNFFRPYIMFEDQSGLTGTIIGHESSSDTFFRITTAIAGMGMEFSANEDINLKLGSTTYLQVDFSVGDVKVKTSVGGALATVVNTAGGQTLADVAVTGQTTLTGDLVMAEKADHTVVTPAAGFGYLWTKNTVPTELWFTNDVGTDVNISASAAAMKLDGFGNLLAGTNAGGALTTGSLNNVVIGQNALATHTFSTGGIFIGDNAANAMNIGNFAVMIGDFAGAQITNGQDNCLIGDGAGFNMTGISTGNVCLGSLAGPFTGGAYSNKLYIDNDETDTPLIGGDFLARTVVIDGDITATTFTANSIVSTAGSIAITPVAGQNVSIDGTTFDGGIITNTSGMSLNASGPISISSSASSVNVESVNVAAGVVTGATSITSTNFVGTLSTAAQPNITSVGIINSLEVSNHIKFPATRVPSADPNTLDDYQEGTFTPTITATGANPTQSYATQTGKYTQIGRMVFFTLDVRMAATGITGGSGEATLGGWPTTIADTGSTAAVVGSNWGTTIGVPTVLLISSGGVFLRSHDGDAFNPASHANTQGSDVQNNTWVRCSGCYMIS